MQVSQNQLSSYTGFKSGFITIVGKPNVGKSSLINALIGEKIAIVSNRPQTTRRRIMGVLTDKNWQMVFLDTPGLHKPQTRLSEYMNKSAYDALDGTDVCIVMLDASHVTEEDYSLVQEMLTLIKNNLLIVLNKIDLVNEISTFKTIDKLSKETSAEIIPISIKESSGLDELIQVLVSRLPYEHPYFPDDMITDQPERILCAEIIREKALLHLRDEVPHGIGVEMLNIKQISDQLIQIDASIYCEKASHKSIIIGKKGLMIKTIGQEARGEIEKLLNMHVNLQLWVTVREGWRNSKADLQALEYE